MTPGPTCHLCGSSALAPIAGCDRLGGVASDGRLWSASAILFGCAGCGATIKALTPAWRKEVSEIYRTYAMYDLSGGSDAVVRDAVEGTLKPRTRLLLERLAQAVALPASGRLLDVGCGAGTLLRAAHDLFPDWRMVGTEVSGARQAEIESLPGVDFLHVGEIDALDGVFDLVTLSHVFEHVFDPIALLRKIAARMAPGGHLLIQVPHFRENPFDLTVFDHCTHFTIPRLCELVEEGGFRVEVVTADWIRKEISLVAAPGAPSVPRRSYVAEAEPSYRIAERLIDWLLALRAAAVGMRGATKTMGIFGTSIASTWLVGSTDLKPDFFVDEDKARIGREFRSAPILSPAQVPDGARILVPLAPLVARAVAARLSDATRLYEAAPDLQERSGP